MTYFLCSLEKVLINYHLTGTLIMRLTSFPMRNTPRPRCSLRFCVDFRAVNDITIKDVTPLPRINESLRTAATGNIFTKLDLRAAYHLIRIKKGDEYKTAFRTRYGIFEYNVMPFGLTNAPATCQKYVSEVLSEYLDIFCVCYLDDILVFSLNQEEHDVHVRKVLLKLAQASLFVKGEKCEFDKTETTFVGFVISADALKMDPAKVAAVREWEAPRTVKGVQSFLGFANFYRRFIRDFSRICTPLFELTKKTQSFVWSSECEAAFHTLKDLFCSEPILKHFDYLLDTVIETDASDRVISAVMSQYHPTDKGLLLHPVAYFSQKMNPAQCNYGVGDKELLAIVESLKSWRFMVESLEKPVLVLTDHRNLAVLKQIPAMNRRQARWAMELSEYRYVITYRPGSLNSRADALTRRYEDLVSSSSEEDKELCAPIIPPENFIGTMSLVDEVKIALSTDKWALDVISALRGQSTKPPDVDLSVCRLDNDGLLFVNDLLYLPNEDLRVRALKNCHDIMPSGHPGQKNTFELLVREYWWPGMRRDVIRYIRNCEVCQRIKSARHSPYGLLKPLTIPQARWTSVSLDFITGLPVSNSFDMILVVVDRLSKMAHFIPCDSSLDAAGFAKLYLSAVYRLHGLPLDIVSDRGSLFTSAFSKALAKLLGIKQNLSTAFHPQTDGQTERVNSILEQYLRGYTNYRQDNWADLLPLAEFSYNDSESSSTMLTPFFANHGFHPRSGRESLPVSVEKGPLRNFVKELDNICQFLKTEITWSRERMTEYANRHKSSAPLLREGDLVWLLSRNIRTTRPSKKLDFKKLGPFKILRKVSSHAYELALPATMKVHPVFHVCLLEPCASDPLPGQKNPPPPPVIVDGEEEFVVKEIIGVSSRGPLQYQFLEYLDSIFIDPFAADRALFHLDNMRQGPSEPFALFLPRFEKVLQDANIIGDRNRISKLQTAMAPALRQAMVYVNVPATYPEFTNCMQNVASKAEQFLPRPRRGHYSAFTDNTTYSPYAAHPVSPAPAGPFVSSVPPSAAARHPDAMDWTPTVTATALQPLTDEERERLRRNRACFRCRQTGHLRQNCPLNFVPTTTVPVRSTNLPQLAAPTPALPLPVPTPASRDMSGNGEL
ncbi:uncharacterized protein BROUX77_002684 [Berkeleyomyces rouxiae]|uniref:uncharacterized protein n=1 Tax=Berkeleyomyces rouxiae TaxID=2035830 RepID=UPI003B790E97